MEEKDRIMTGTYKKTNTFWKEWGWLIAIFSLNLLGFTGALIWAILYGMNDHTYTIMLACGGTAIIIFGSFMLFKRNL